MILLSHSIRFWYRVGAPTEFDEKGLTWVEYLMGHFSEGSVELFINQNSSGWHNHEIPVRISWGGRRSLPVTVTALRMRDESSEIGFNNQAFVNAGRPTLVRRKSPPLGIPIASLDEMRNEYAEHIRNVLVKELDHYVSIAYDDQSSKLPERLLQSVCLYYQMSIKGKNVGKTSGKKVGVGGVDEVSGLRESVFLSISYVWLSALFTSLFLRVCGYARHALCVYVVSVADLYSACSFNKQSRST